MNNNSFLYVKKNYFLAHSKFFIFSILFLIILYLSFFIPSPAINLDNIMRAPSLQNIFGTDILGRDIAGRIIIGLRYSLSISLLTVCLTACLGLVLGMICAANTKILPILFLFINIAIIIPPFIICLLLVSRTGNGTLSLLFGQFLAFLPVFSRLAYKELRTVLNQNYAQTAIGLGKSPLKVSYIHGFPILLPKLRAQILSMLALAIGIESGLSYLGLGPPLPDAGLGQMLYEATNYWRLAPWYPASTLAVFFLLLGIINVLSKESKNN